jgi:hypothetical protein
MKDIQLINTEILKLKIKCLNRRLDIKCSYSITVCSVGSDVW